MENSSNPFNIEKYLMELISRGTISNQALLDKTLMNYLNTVKFDVDYIKSVLPNKY